MRLIDADALINELNNNRYPGAPYVDIGISIAIGKVCDALTIEERKTGKWIKTDKHDIYYQLGYECSVCGVLTTCHGNYCPNCGADMREGVQND